MLPYESCKPINRTATILPLVISWQIGVIPAVAHHLIHVTLIIVKNHICNISIGVGNLLHYRIYKTLIGSEIQTA